MGAFVPEWKARMNRLARRGYIVRLCREMGPRDAEVWYRAKAFIICERVYQSSRREVAQSGWTSTPEEALRQLQGELGIADELGIAEEEIWRA